MTDRTDLTENRDFREPSNFLVSRIIAEETFELANERAMSTEEFEKVFAWEQIFGRRGYTSETYNAFRKNESVWMEDMAQHCARCGREFRMPWEKVYDVCRKCDEILNDGHERAPWKNQKMLVSNRDNTMQIFSLR